MLLILVLAALARAARYTTTTTSVHDVDCFTDIGHQAHSFRPVMNLRDSEDASCQEASHLFENKLVDHILVILAPGTN